MTPFEHALVGIDGALAAGLHRRYGWQIVALAGCAAVLPDWDGLTILCGARLYAEGHRIWGHNLLVATALAALFAAVAYRFDMLTRTQRRLARRWRALAVDDRRDARTHSLAALTVWVLVGIAATYSHLLADLVFSHGAGLPEWRLPLLWPFSQTTWAWPLAPWGDAGTTIVLAVGMFAMLRWPARIQPLAAGTLFAAAGYIGLRGLIG